LRALSENWWITELRGLTALLLAFSVLSRTSDEVVSLAAAFGAYALADGIFLIVQAVKCSGGAEPPWQLALNWLIDLVLGTIRAIVFSHYAGSTRVLGEFPNSAEGADDEQQDQHGWPHLNFVAGGLGAAIGMATLLGSGWTDSGMLWLIAVWACATGFLQLLAALRFRRDTDGQWVLVPTTAASLLFGFWCIAVLGSGGLISTTTIRDYMLVFALLLGIQGT
jgi:uncharacterized membrane protein HdeD (DUF308 family)